MHWSQVWNEQSLNGVTVSPPADIAQKRPLKKGLLSASQAGCRQKSRKRQYKK
jgi:hypothetical protein